MTKNFTTDTALNAQESTSKMRLSTSRANKRRPLAWTLLIFLSFGTRSVRSQQDQNPLTMNGGSVLAMAGKDCVALAVDKRFASGAQMVNIAPRHVYVPSPELMVAFTGLEGDVQSLSHSLEKQVASKLGRGLGFMNENRQQRPVITPRAMASLTSHVLYNRRQAPYYVEPLIVGLTTTTKTCPDGATPFLCSMDCIGAKSISRAFVCAGAASDSIFGTAEALWKPDLEADELVEVCANAFLSALERDCLSGYGAMVYLIHRNGITEYDMASRND
ncbi:Proteasome subunit beta type-3 [Seminavis robusta]|uniref:Proteasome subunit beta type-3 n=1 Tax=Seminavis robusta TaxID=568900 RepID=A0A9N8HD53_9STRA|nr:Proteasome subunit beta type-3 [Seminavis robusta]|eukprot:Sro328_g118640.1 Proteasome subunit beta type-3 (275) ;mRNA; r:37465-38498